MKSSTTASDLTTLDSLPNIDGSLRQLLKDVRLSLDTVHLTAEDREDVLESFRHFTAELCKPTPRPERLWRFWSRVDDLAPTAGHALAQAEAIQQLSQVGGFGIHPRGGFLNEVAAGKFVASVEDARIKQVLGLAYRQLLTLAQREGVRPEGAFDLLYFYKAIAALAQQPGLHVATLPAEQVTSS